MLEAAQNMKIDESAMLDEIANHETAANSMCPLQGWKTFYSQSPLLTIAVHVLSAPITSAATEPANSTFGWIHNNKRNRLKTQRAGKIT